MNSTEEMNMPEQKRQKLLSLVHGMAQKKAETIYMLKFLLIDVHHQSFIAKPILQSLILETLSSRRTLPLSQPLLLGRVLQSRSLFPPLRHRRSRSRNALPTREYDLSPAVRYDGLPPQHVRGELQSDPLLPVRH